MHEQLALFDDSQLKYCTPTDIEIACALVEVLLEEKYNNSDTKIYWLLRNLSGLLYRNLKECGFDRRCEEIYEEIKNEI